MNGLSGLSALTALSPWWLALSALLLPIWWHRKKRRRVQSVALATARFLPAAPPRQLRVWRWDDPLLLALRCALLAALVAWLAALSPPWRGDTVIVDGALSGPADRAWVEQQAAAAGLADAARVTVPDGERGDVLAWLQTQEHQWRAEARLLVLARVQPMAATPPRFAHAVELRIAAPAVHPDGAGTPPVQRIVLATTPERAAAWRALFAAFNASGVASGMVSAPARYVFDEQPGPATTLIVWDRPQAPPAHWRAPLWWLGAAASAPELAGARSVTVNGIALAMADSAHGRLWASSAWPPADADGAAALYETWQALRARAPAYPLAAQTLPALRAAPLALPGRPAAAWLAYLLLALFIVERSATHARRS